MMARRQGRIINISSGAATNQVVAFGAYSAAKAALTHWANCLAAEVKDYGIAVFAYAPGLVRTAMAEYASNSPEVDPAVRRRFQANLAEGRDTPIEQTVERFMFLASGQADPLSGRFIRVSDDPNELLRKAETILREDLLTLRLRS